MEFFFKINKRDSTFIREMRVIDLNPLLASNVCLVVGSVDSLVKGMIIDLNPRLISNVYLGSFPIQ